MQFDATKKYHEFLGAITQYSADGILAFSRTGQIILANRAAASLLGYEVAELERMNLQAILGNELVDGTALVQFFDQGEITQEQSVPIPLEATHKSGAAVPIEISIGQTTLSDGEKVFIANFRDITKRLEIEARLNSQAQIIRQMWDAMVVTDQSFQVQDCNHAMFKLLNMKRKRVIGRSLFDLLEFQFFDILKPADVCKVALEQGKWNGLVDVETHKGRKMIADVAVFPITGVFGASTMLGVVIRDVTERMETQTRINQTQKIEALGRLAGGVAHDVNNLLFPIFLNLEAAVEDLEGHSDLQETRNDIREAMEACLKIKSMVQHILLFSRKNSLSSAALDMSEEMHEAWKLAQIVVPSSIECKVTIAPACGSFVANSVQFSQVILNLVSNAVGAMGATGTLMLTLQKVRVKDVPPPKYFSLRAREAAMIEVTDTGSGIEEDILDKIFDPFFTTKEVGQGTGLGLTEVASIVQALGGAIDLESEVGQGTTFKVYLPVDEG